MKLSTTRRTEPSGPGKPANCREEVVCYGFISSKREKWLIFILCCIAATRIFFFSAAFPYFNNVDEPFHFDLILKSSDNQSFFLTDRVNPEAGRIWLLFGSPEYLRKASEFPGGNFGPPPFSWPAGIREQALHRFSRFGQINIEEYSPPLYYLLTGKWMAIGKVIGLRDGGLLYWCRFLNIPLMVLLVIIAYAISRIVPYSDASMVFGLPLLVAFMPQSVFYSLNSDVLSPLPSGIAYLLIIKGLLGANLSWKHYACLGLVVSCALLTKLANIPLLFMTMLFLAVRIVHGGRTAICGKNLVKATAFLLCLVVPLAVWTTANILNIGELTGASHKIRLLGWTYKPLGNLLDHPIFSLAGISYFLQGNLQTFWRGEFTWGLEALSVSYMDYFYSISTILLLLATCVILARKSTEQPGERAMVAISLAGIFSAFAFVAILSMIYDFGKCFYPSPAKPFFTSGRLILCMMFPILFCYTWAVDYLATVLWKGRKQSGILAIILICALMTISEVYLAIEPLRSPYNFFHIPLGPIK
jgi:hypothetical protein